MHCTHRKVPNWLRSTWLLAAVLAACPLQAETSPPHLAPAAPPTPVQTTAPNRINQPPNIIFVLADDLGYGDIGCYGQKKILTPNLDRMAAEGMRFTQAYAGCTICAPSRCCLLTGLHTGHATIRGNPRKGHGDFALGPADLTVAKVLKQAGYATGMFGKWGLGESGSTGLPRLQGFDEFVGYLNHKQAHDPFPRVLHTHQGEMKLHGNQKDGRGVYSGDVFTEQALRFIRQHRDQPFFLYLPYTAGHFEYELKSAAPYSDKNWPKKEKFYAAMITRMDRDIGRIGTLLKELNLDDETIVFFSSDNGSTAEGGHEPRFFGSNAPLRGQKRDMYEGGIRVPMIVRWPGHIKAGSVSHQPWAFWDFLPTAAEIAGAPAPKNIDGISILPTLLGQPQKQHEYFYWEFHEHVPKQALRTGDWKAVRLAPDLPLEVYNLKSDSAERRNVAGEYQDVVARIEKLLQGARSPNAAWPLKTDHPTEAATGATR